LTMKHLHGRLSTLRRGYEGFIAATFVIVIFTQGALMGAGVNITQPLNEKRDLAIFPGWSPSMYGWARWTEFFEDYLNDHAPLRPMLTRIVSTGGYHLLGESINPDVTIGQDDWLFFTNEMELGEFRRLRPLDKKQKEKFSLLFRSLKQWLDTRGIKIIFIITPDKSEIYSQFMPLRITRLDNPSIMDQILKIAHDEGVETVDPRPQLQKAVERGENIYFRYDTHWNQWGGYLAYREFMGNARKLLPSIAAVLEVTDTSKMVSESRDLLEDMGEPYGARQYKTASFEWPARGEFTVVDPVQSPGAPRIQSHINSNSQLPRALLYGDSFSAALMPYFREHFSRLTFVTGSTISSEMIYSEKPDILILQVVQRNAPTLIHKLESMSDMFREIHGVIPSLHMNHGAGDMMVDPNTFIGKGWTTSPGSPASGYMAYGPYERLEAGRWKVSFRVKRGASSGALGFVDVACSQGRQVLAKKSLESRDFQAPDVWKEIELSFEVPGAGVDDMEYRLFVEQGADLSLDTITVSKDPPDTRMEAIHP